MILKKTQQSDLIREMAWVQRKLLTMHLFDAKAYYNSPKSFLKFSVSFLGVLGALAIR